MSSTRDALMLVAGVAIGGIGTFAIVNGAAGPTERPAASVAPIPSGPASLAAPDAATPEQRLGSVQRELGEERTTRLHAEARVAALEEELSRARSAPAAGTPTVMAVPAPGPAASAKKPLDAAQVAARLKEVEGSIDGLIAAKDGKKLLALYGELAQYGKAAWPLAAKIGALFGGFERGDSEELGLNGMEFFKVLVASDFMDLYSDVLDHPEGYEKDFRKMALWGLSMGDAAAAAPKLLGALKTEKDPQTLQMIAGMLAQSSANGPPQPGVADAVLDAINAQKNKQTRQTLVWTLSQMQGEEATRAIGSLAAAETDPQVKQQLELSLKVRAAPVAGYYVMSVQPSSEGEQAGLKPGDVLTTLNGKPLKSWQQLQGMHDGSDEAAAALVPVTVYRDGQTFGVNLKGGKSIWEIGVAGDFAKGTAR